VFWYLSFFNPEGEKYADKMYLPDHSLEAVVCFYYALRNGYKSFAYEAFRGGLKSTVFTLAMNAYRLGNYPHKEVIVGQANDSKAHENTEFVSSLIADSPAFAIFFPGIVPDPSKGWGANGYEIKDKLRPYGLWRKLRTKVPTLLGAGYKSAAILGEHPRLHGMLDDVSTFKNTRFAREKDALVKTVEKEIRPAFDKVDIQIDVFTPWAQNDPGDIQKKKKSTLHLRHPVYKLDRDGKLTTTPQWNEVWPADKIEELRGEMPPAEFAQAMLCDIEAAQGQHLKKDWLWLYPHEEIDPEWRRILAIDYASVGKKAETVDRDYFAIGQFALHPNRFLILETGFYGHVLAAEAQEMALNWGERLGAKLLLMAIERQGKGEDFYNWMLLNAPFRVTGPTPGNKDKAWRFEYEMAPVFRSGKARISDSTLDPFLLEAVNQWLAFDGLDTYFDDILDTMYYGVKAAKNLIKPSRGDRRVDPKQRRPKQVNPIYAGFGRK